MIKSENYSEGNAGFRIKADGDVEFNNGTFRGELQARYIRVTGTISSGINYLLRADYSIMRSEGDFDSDLFFNMNIGKVSKVLVTPARGSCTARFILNKIPGLSALLNGSYYKIKVNGIDVTGWVLQTPYDADRTIIVPNIPLNNSINNVELHLTPHITDPTGTLAVGRRTVNTTFELLCNEDPGLLAFLG